MVRMGPSEPQCRHPLPYQNAHFGRDMAPWVHGHVVCYVLACLVASLRGSSETPVPRHVIIFGVDGLQMDVLHRRLPAMPALTRLRDLGAHTDRARSVGPSRSLANWAALLFSADAALTGMIKDDWLRNTSTLTQVTGRSTALPHIFAVLKAQRPDVVTAVYYNWYTVRYLLPPETTVDRLHTEFECWGCEPCLAKATEMVDHFLDYFPYDSPAPTVTYLEYDSVDECGHEHGGDGFGYKALATLDASLDKLYHRFADRGLWDSTLLIMTSDHGRDECRGHHHGHWTDAELTTQWLAVGAGVRRGHTLRRSVVSAVDTAPTALWALNLTWPVQWRGRPVWEAFEAPPPPAGVWWFDMAEVPTEDRSRAPCFVEDLEWHPPLLRAPCAAWDRGSPALRVGAAFPRGGAPHVVVGGRTWALDLAEGALTAAPAPGGASAAGAVATAFVCDGALYFGVETGEYFRETAAAPERVPELEAFGAADAGLENPEAPAHVWLLRGRGIWQYNCATRVVTPLRPHLPFGLAAVQAAVGVGAALYLFAGLQVYVTDADTFLSAGTPGVDPLHDHGAGQERRLAVYDLCSLAGPGVYPCFDSPAAVDFTGTLNYTKSGRLCQAWAASHPHKSGYCYVQFCPPPRPRATFGASMVCAARAARQRILRVRHIAQR